MRCETLFAGKRGCGASLLNYKSQYISLKHYLPTGGQPQGIAPTVVTVQLGRPIRTSVGAIPCGRPPLPRGAYLNGIVPCGCPAVGE